jgi:anti-sigma factor RsiW
VKRDIMTTCEHVERLIARSGDGASALGDAERRELDVHLASCPACRVEVDHQQQVAAILRSREPVALPAGFLARLSDRIDREDAGWLGLANWRALTVGLAPIAAALVIFAYVGAGTASTATVTSAPTTQATTTVTFDNLVAANAGNTPAAVFLQPSTGGDVLLESVLTGGLAGSGGPSYVR